MSELLCHVTKFGRLSHHVSIVLKLMGFLYETEEIMRKEQENAVLSRANCIEVGGLNSSNVRFTNHAAVATWKGIATFCRALRSGSELRNYFSRLIIFIEGLRPFAAALFIRSRFLIFISIWISRFDPQPFSMSGRHPFQTNADTQKDSAFRIVYAKRNRSTSRANHEIRF